MTSISDSDVLFTLHLDHSIRMLSIVDIVLLSLFAWLTKKSPMTEIVNFVAIFVANYQTVNLIYNKYVSKSLMSFILGRHCNIKNK